MNVIRNFIKLDREKQFFRTYVVGSIACYTVVMTGLYVGNVLHTEEIEMGQYEKLPHLEIQKRAVICGLCWPFAIWDIYNNKK